MSKLDMNEFESLKCKRDCLDNKNLFSEQLNVYTFWLKRLNFSDSKVKFVENIFPVNINNQL